jgi:hypothetical protein
MEGNGAPGELKLPTLCLEQSERGAKENCLNVRIIHIGGSGATTGELGESGHGLPQGMPDARRYLQCWRSLGITRDSTGTTGEDLAAGQRKSPLQW